MNLKVFLSAGTVLAGGLSFGAIKIPTEGLLFDLDASDAATLQMDSSGFVTNWLSSRTDESFRCVDETGAFLDAEAFGGRGALVFGRNANDTERFPTRYLHDGNLRNQTVVMVLKWSPVKSGVPCMGEIYGQNGQDSGIRGDYYNRMYTWGDSLLGECMTWYNGVKQTKRSAAYATDIIPSGTTDVGKEAYVFCAVMTNDVVAAKTGNNNGTYTPKLGGYSPYSTITGKRYFVGHLAEVIVYDRQLSEDEVDYLNDVLMHKWYGNDPKPENTWITVEGSVGPFGSPVPAYGKYVEGEVGNTFSIADCLSTDADGKRVVTADKTAGQRSIYLGYEVVDAAGTVLQSSETDESFTFTATEPVTVRWIIRRECRATVKAGANGQVAIAGGAAGTEVEAWSYAGTKVRLQAIPSAGYHLAYWKGDVGAIDILDPDQKVLLGGETQLEAVFAPGEPDYPPMLTRGLVFKLDATDADSLRADANGFVTNWFSRVGDMPFDESKTGVRPYVQADAMGGRGSVRFGLQKDGATLANTPLHATALGRAPVRTFLLVLSQVKNSADIFYLLGYAGDFFSDTTYNYGLTCYYAGRLYNQSFIVNGWVWMDDRYPRQYPGKLSTSTGDFVAHFGDTKNETHVLVCEDRDETAADGSHKLGLGNYNGEPTHSSGIKRCFAGDMGEVAGYDRTLSPAEVRYVMAFMNKKWRGIPFEMPRWTMAASVSADATYGNLFLDGAGTVTVAAGVTLSVTNLLVVKGDVRFVLGKGATLDIPEIVKHDPEDAVSIEMDEATLVLGELGGTYAYDSETQRYNRLSYAVCPEGPEAALPPLTLPGALSGMGTVVKRGTRGLKLGADEVVPDGLTLKLLGGTFDLNGHSLAVASLEGPVGVTNSAAERVTLTVGRETDFDLEARVQGALDIVRVGAGKATLGGVQAFDGTLALAGENALGDFAPGSIPGLICHLDASRIETLDLDAEGRVLGWRSQAGDGARFVPKTGPNRDNPPRSYLITPPVYSATAMDGKPGLLFGQDESGAALSVTNALFCEFMYKAMSIVAVVKPHTSPCSYGTYWGHVWGQSHYDNDGYAAPALAIVKEAADGYKKWRWLNVPETAGYLAHLTDNGTSLYDLEAGETDGDRFTTAGEAHVVGVTFSDDVTPAAGRSMEYAPGIGILRQHTRSYRGVIAEICVYSRELSADELAQVTTALMRKWDIAPYEGAATAGADLLAMSGGVSLGAGATLDLGGTTQEVASVAYDGNCEISDGAFKPAAMIVIPNPSGVLPLLTATGCTVDVTGCDLTFESDPESGRFIKATKGGTLVGPFKSETGNTTPVSMNARRASVGDLGFFLFVR